MRLRATAIIDKGGPPGRFVALTITALPAADASANDDGTASTGVDQTDASGNAPTVPVATP
ncbi:hypothetical protein ACSD7O_23965 [Methylorubrum extorquens]|uniref:hypothetical protein n=1 Tax=Methylorubrum extorquens TaxID=408 RepID=UPI003F5DB495